MNQKDQDLSLDGAFDQLQDDVSLAFGEKAEAPPFHEWVTGTILDGKPFSYDRHEYLIEPYRDTHRDQTFRKATQLGLTSNAMLRAIYGARYRGFKGILYLFPSRADVIDFSKGRVSPLIEDNPDTIGHWIRDTDSAGIKQIWTAFIYFRGMRSVTGLKSVPVDFLVMDELDEAPQTAIDIAMKRLSHSEYKEILSLSNPTLPDYGIDAAFQLTDQRYWLLKCPKCNHYTCMEDIFPHCFLTINGGVMRACEKCQAELNPSAGEWVAKKPGVKDKRGYQFSQLWSYFVEPKDILHDFRTTKHLQQFWNLTIGVGYIEAENRLSVEEVLALCGSEGIASYDPGPCFMGVDQGNDLHVVIGKRYPPKAGKLVHIAVYKEWEELDRLMKNFNISRCVVDALPEQRNAKKFAERFRGRVFLNFYNIHQKGSYKWDEKELIVNCNRTESLDASHKEVLDQALVLPKECDVTRDFAKQLHNVGKKIEEDEETGSKRYVYVKLGEDHFRHAFNYETMARQYGSDSFFADVVG